ncbi:class I SAM-dependent methyltransferase [Candidatus Falkowbacteria bacterium]|nr:class I SAM-dependent methyltransferase [Candidatus Falkowbacteria bacterium]
MNQRNCPVCDSLKSKSLYSNSDYKYIDANGEIYRAPLHYVVCDDCAHIYKNPNPDSEQFNELYRSAMIDAAETSAEENDARAAQHFNAFIKLANEFFSESQEPISVLEIGCGNGKMLKEICVCYHDKIKQAKGIDPSLPLGRALSGNNYFEFENIRFDQLDLSRKYDFIILDNVFEHFDFPREELNRLKQILTMDGQIYIAIPNILLTPTGFVDMFAGHPSNYLLENFNWLIDQSGFHLLRYDYGKWLTCLIRPKRTGDDSVKLDIISAKSKVNELIGRQFRKNNDVRGKIILLIEKEVAELKRKGKKLIIFGAGCHTQELLCQIDFENVICGLIDKNSYYHGKKRMGYLVYSPAQISSLEFGKILLSSQSFENDMRKTLINLGVAQDRIISIYENVGY